MSKYNIYYIFNLIIILNKDRKSESEGERERITNKQKIDEDEVMFDFIISKSHILPLFSYHLPSKTFSYLKGWFKVLIRVIVSLASF